MQPTLREGNVVVGINTRNFNEGDVVVAYHRGREVIKRVDKYENGQLWLTGDNKSENHDIGPVSDKDIEGKVVFPIKLKLK